MTKVNVYEIKEYVDYDEPTQIMGSKQLRGFAIEQIQQLSGEDIEELIAYDEPDDISIVVAKSMRNRVRELVKEIVENKISIRAITDREAIELLKLRLFIVDKLNIE